MIASLVLLMGANAGGVDNMFPEGIRLNNPCNLKKTHDHWHGSARLQDNKHFVRFLTPQSGLRAAMKVLLTYEDNYRITTINSIIMRFAPPAENNTQSYIDDVSIRMGWPPSAFLDLHDDDTLVRLTQAIVMHENGHAPLDMPLYWYTEEVYQEAAMSALSENEQ